jgi:Putative transmembrane protein (PGPGW)
MTPKVKKTLTFVAGWILVLAGLAALVLPGPGLLLLLCGLILLATEYTWAQKWVDPVERRAVALAHANVQSPHAIALSAVGACALLAVGIFWGMNPTIPEFWIFGPRLPFGGWGVGTTVTFSGVLAIGLLVYSVKRYRGKPLPVPSLSSRQGGAAVRTVDEPDPVAGDPR